MDVFFDNVGGELLDTVLRRLANRGRVVLCGDISTYNLEGPPPPLRNIKYVMGKRARMEGFNTLDHWDSYGAPPSSRRGSPTGASSSENTSSTASTELRKRSSVSSPAITSASSRSKSTDHATRYGRQLRQLLEDLVHARESRRVICAGTAS